MKEFILPLIAVIILVILWVRMIKNAKEHRFNNDEILRKHKEYIKRFKEVENIKGVDSNKTKK